MHIDFDPNKVDWNFIIQPSNEEKQFGGGSYTPFAGIPYQRGAGIGSIFRSLLRFLIPIGKEAGSAIGRQSLESGVRVLSGVLDGKDVKQALKDEGRSGLKNLLDKASTNLTKRNEAAQGGSGHSAFDFKKYKRELAAHPQTAMTAFHNDYITPQKTINRTQKRPTYLHSTIGPTILPTITTRKRPNSSNNKKGKPRKIRIDSLGIY